MITKHIGDHKWTDVAVSSYQQTGTNFKDVTRQVLFDGLGDLPVQLRYFEVQAGGHSSLEHHEHIHLVFITHGAGQVLLGDEIHDIKDNDVITITPHTWHQFHAASDAPLGFLCLVNAVRDKFQLPTEEDLTEFAKKPKLASFIRV